MSAMVCGKRSYFEELEGSPVTKKHRWSSSSSSPVKMTSSPIDRLMELFPNLDNQLLEKALEENGNDLDSAIKSLNELCLGYVNGNSGSVAMSNAATTEEYVENSAAPDNIPRSGVEWVELFVTEMTNATSFDDARSRCMRMLESLEKSITERAGGEAAQSLHKENMFLKERIEALLREDMGQKERIEALLRENTILKRGVAIQYEHQKDYDNITQENQHLKQLVSMHLERVRNLELEKYALTIRMQAQEGSSMPGRRHPDVF